MSHSTPYRPSSSGSPSTSLAYLRVKSQSFLGSKKAAQQHLLGHFVIILPLGKPQAIISLCLFPYKGVHLKITFCNSGGKITVLH